MTKNENKKALGDLYEKELGNGSFRPTIIKLPVKFFLLNLILAVVAGGLAGYFSQRYNANSINNSSASSTLLGLSNNSQPLDVSLLQQQRYQQDAAQLDILREQVVGIFNQKITADAPIANVYTSKDLVGHGVIVTSDGWILTTLSSEPKNLVVITFDKKVLPIKADQQDPLTGLWFAKVEVNNLRAAGLADISHLPLTQAVAVAQFLVAPYSLEVTQDNLNSVWYGKSQSGTDLLRSTEKIDYYLKLTDPKALGLVFDVNSALVGVAQNGLVTPVSYLDQAINSLASNKGKIIRTFLGVNYLSLSEAWGLAAKFTEGQAKGALVIGDASQKVLAITAGSPAQTAGLKAGDVVTKVNNEEINEVNSLTKLIQDYPPNTQVELTFWRDGKEQKVKFILGQISS